MAVGIHAKEGEIQFWGTSQNPGTWVGSAFHEDCCPCDCWIFEDTFAREDSTSLGDDWNEVAGDWGIEDEELVEEYDEETGTSGAQLFCTRSVPAASAGEMFIEVEVPVASIEDGDEYFIWPCCISDSKAGDIQVKFSWDETANQWTTTITGGNGGDSAIYTTAATGTPINIVFKVCADHELSLTKAWISPTVNEYAAWDDADPGTGQYCAIGHENTGHQNRFDNFSVEELRNGSEICRSCFCVCEEFAMPTTLTATIVNATYRAACLEGESWEMEAVLGPQEVMWEGGLEKSTGYATEELNFRLTCGNGPPSSFSLIPLEPLDRCHNTNVQKSADAELSMCVPLQLYFGPYTLGFSQDCELCYKKNEPGCTGEPPISENCSGEYWILITI
jgi:hypothetical protein